MQHSSIIEVGKQKQKKMDEIRIIYIVLVKSIFLCPQCCHLVKFYGKINFIVGKSNKFSAEEFFKCNKCQFTNIYCNTVNHKATHVLLAINMLHTKFCFYRQFTFEIHSDIGFYAFVAAACS